MVLHSSSSTDDGSIRSTKYLFLRLSQKAWTMAHVLGLRRLQDLVQGSGSLRAGPACILGIWYQLEGDNNEIDPQMLEQLLADFQCKIWCTYRRDFAPLGPAQLTSDIGWGCTLRSGQMLLAEALLQLAAGRSWWVDNTDARTSNPHVHQCLDWLWDSPEPQHALSLHHICEAGKPHGVVIGQWLGPWVLCKALETAVNALHPWGLHVHVVCDPGGGAPTVSRQSLLELFSSFSSATTSIEQAGSSEQAGEKQQQEEQQPEEQQREGQQQQQQQQQEGREQAAAAAGSSSTPTTPALLLLIPLTLGLDKVNPRYLPQLKKVLTFPHSIGIVGGRPGSSLFFVGYQEDNLLYLDPHDSRVVAKLPDDAATYFCNSLRLMPMTSMDPSLAMGFLCKSQEDVQSLCSQLAELESEAGGAPLLTIVNETTAAQSKRLSEEHGSYEQEEKPSEPGEQGEGGEWEMV